METGARRARVALESTLIAHGLPRPDNIETAIASEEAVAAAGAWPATVGVIGGEVRVGMTRAEIERLAGAPAGTVIKASRRDLAAVVARGIDAATTVSATLALARSRGITVMATGGLGGVHRGASMTFDVSTDLDELARAGGAVVVCSGVKSILDIAATLERMETAGIAVVGYRTDEFPAFTTVSSGLPGRDEGRHPGRGRRDRPGASTAGLPGAIVVAQPPPADLAIGRDEMEAAIAVATDQARTAGVVGKAITPFLLDAVRVATGGRSLAVNKALIVANAGLAGEIARAIVDD